MIPESGFGPRTLLQRGKAGDHGFEGHIVAFEHAEPFRQDARCPSSGSESKRLGVGVEKVAPMVVIATPSRLVVEPGSAVDCGPTIGVGFPVAVGRTRA
jgi:hypothetical protein